MDSFCPMATSVVEQAVIQAVTFLLLMVGGHDSHLKGSLNHPEKGTKNCQVVFCFGSIKFLLPGGFFLSTPVLLRSVPPCVILDLLTVPTVGMSLQWHHHLRIYL